MVWVAKLIQPMTSTTLIGTCVLVADFLASLFVNLADAAAMLVLLPSPILVPTAIGIDSSTCVSSIPSVTIAS